MTLLVFMVATDRPSSLTLQYQHFYINELKIALNKSEGKSLRTIFSTESCEAAAVTVRDVGRLSVTRSGQDGLPPPATSAVHPAAAWPVKEYTGSNTWTSSSSSGDLDDT